MNLFVLPLLLKFTLQISLHSLNHQMPGPFFTTALGLHIQHTHIKLQHRLHIQNRTQSRRGMANPSALSQMLQFVNHHVDSHIRPLPFQQPLHLCCRKALR